MNASVQIGRSKSPTAIPGQALLFCAAMGLQMFVVQPSRLHVIVVQPSRLQCLWCGHRAAGVRSAAIGPQVFVVWPTGCRCS